MKPLPAPKFLAHLPMCSSLKDLSPTTFGYHRSALWHRANRSNAGYVQEQRRTQITSQGIDPVHSAPRSPLVSSQLLSSAATHACPANRDTKQISIRSPSFGATHRRLLALLRHLLRLREVLLLFLHRSGILLREPCEDHWKRLHRHFLISTHHFTTRTHAQTKRKGCPG